MPVLVTLANVDPGESLAAYVADVLLIVDMSPDMPREMFRPRILATACSALVEVVTIAVVSGCGRPGL